MSSNILDVNPLERLSTDIAISNANYESVMNGLVAWNNSKQPTVTIRLATNTPPYYVDYVLPTRYSYDTNSGTSSAAIGLNVSQFAYANRYRMVCAYSGVDDPDAIDTSDKVTLRITADKLNGATWELYENVTCYDEIVIDEDYVIGATEKYTHSLVKGVYYRASYEGADHKYYTELRKTSTAVDYGQDCDATPTYVKVVGYTDASNNDAVSDSSTIEYAVCRTQSHEGVYVRDPKKTVDSRYSVYKPDSGFRYLCPLYKDGTVYHAGDLVFYTGFKKDGTVAYEGGEFFICLVDGTEATPFHDDIDEDDELQQRAYATTYWASVIVRPTGKTITGSGVYRYTVKTDLDGFILRKTANSSSGDETGMFVNILGNRSIPSGETKQHTGLDIFSTSNYVKWPTLSSKWVTGANYRTDENRSTYMLQDYTATMVFSHKDPAVKYKNIINYDGPDLDQGLCIFLPVEVTENEKLYVPENGTMFEFLIRIWPNPQYNGNQDNDLIINKSQVYVYSATSDMAIDDLLQGGAISTNCTPIAKFSMARLTNFYVKSETIGVPDRPVMYKARFIYSKDEGMWKTYDYYQFPDHVFLSPGGFVDPMDKDGEYGVETAGFPLYQDPFCKYDLTPVKVTPEYRNQLKI